jgi:tRNA threonylcarbamoyladenosine biosynthesis protein TsaE
MRTIGTAQTEALGEQIGRLLQAGHILCLSGELGAGKTALARGIGRGFGALEPVTSPTFVLIHEHRRAADSLILYHLDCYRLETPDAAESLGLDDLFHSGGAAMIEWPERVVTYLPPDHLWISLEIADPDDTRLITFTAKGPHAAALLATLIPER